MKKQTTFLLSVLSLTAVLLWSCESDETATPDLKEAQFVVAVEAATGTDVLLTVDDLTTGEISPMGQGVEQPAWMTFFSGGDQIIATGYTSDNISTAYNLGADGNLLTGETLITDQGIYAATSADEEVMLAVGTTRAGYEDRTIYVIDKNNMAISKRVLTRIDERQEEGLVAFPTGIYRRGNQVFLSYYLMGSGEEGGIPAFATPNSNQARIAVYSYPDLVFEGLITDDRTSDIGVYTAVTAIQETENGDLYTFSTSSNASGFFPTPTNPSGFLRIKAGASDFDEDYFFNFEQASGGLKINNAIYAGNGKMVVRTITDDSGLWAAYGPNTETPICGLAIADLTTKTVTVVNDVPLHGGEWGMAHLVHEGKVYINVSDSRGGHIYQVDPETATAEKGAHIDGHYAKGIFVLNK
ncbi:DUF4374 domain-containing protein [Persicobacter sp. CCB-QB2]|uniref:DUF4374 domain-containing protein n=1 Tax=Persicobacter sp. CCB-QB2 TaxID=1561025 RepID=UPI0006A947F6|nr:DUF4374 domain-containing protein [Persicobacter sp. CCB-QB2]